MQHTWLVTTWALFRNNLAHENKLLKDTLRRGQGTHKYIRWRALRQRLFSILDVWRGSWLHLCTKSMFNQQRETIIKFSGIFLSIAET